MYYFVSMKVLFCSQITTFMAKEDRLTVFKK